MLDDEALSNSDWSYSNKNGKKLGDTARCGSQGDNLDSVFEL